MQQYRTRPRIISEVLLKAYRSAVDGGASVSGFMRTCNLSYAAAAHLLGELVGSGLLLEVRADGTVKYKISERGSVFLEKYAQLKEFVEAYGLKL